MKIVIYHSFNKKKYDDKIMELLRNVGIKKDEIIFISNTAYGIPDGAKLYLVDRRNQKKIYKIN